MTDDQRSGQSRLVAMVVLAVAIGALAAANPSLAADASCCFTNARYTGTCSVTPGKDETCETILAYLNNPSSTGRSYCGGTTIRDGWSKVGCSTGKAPARSGVTGTAPGSHSDKPAQP